jgi:hypothetical protein
MISTCRHCIAPVSGGFVVASLDDATLNLRHPTGTVEQLARGVSTFGLAGAGDRLLVARVAGSTLYAALSTDAGATFNDSYLVTGTGGSVLPAPLVWETGAAVAWGVSSTGVQPGAWVAEYDGATWTSTCLSPTGLFPDLAGNGAGHLWCAWREGDGRTSGYTLWLAEKPAGGQWSPGVRLGEGMDPALAWDGDLLIGWHSGGFVASMGRVDGGRIVDVQVLDRAGMFVGLAAGGGKRAAVWSRYSTVGDAKLDEARNVVVHTGDQDIVVTSEGSQVQPGVAVDGEGNVAVAWADRAEGTVRVEGVGG